MVPFDTMVAAMAVGGKLINPNPQNIITGVVTDSRKVEPGNLFVAIKGEKVDGHDYLAEVFSKGATAALVDHVPEGTKGTCIVAKNTIKGLQDIAEWYRRSLDVKVIGVTGSVGKTSTKEIIASVLVEGFRVQKTIGNYNNEIGLPLTILGLEPTTQIAVLEMGISDFGEMRVLSKVARPDICVITNIGQCHLEFLHDRDGVLKAKSEIFEYMAADGKVYLNGDDDKLRTIKDVNGKKPVFFGLKDNNLIYPKSVKSMGLNGTKMNIRYKYKEFSAEIHMIGEHMVTNAMVAAAIGLDMGLPEDKVKRGLRDAKTIEGRCNLIKFNDAYIIDDCYNASPASMKAAIDILQSGVGRNVAILGDMFELGADSPKLHAEVGEYAACSTIDKLICVGENSKYMYAAAMKNKGSKLGVAYYATLDDLLTHLTNEVKPEDNILVKSSHGMEFDRLVDALKRRPR